MTNQSKEPQIQHQPTITRLVESIHNVHLFIGGVEREEFLRGGRLSHRLVHNRYYHSLCYDITADMDIAIGGVETGGGT